MTLADLVDSIGCGVRPTTTAGATCAIGRPDETTSSTASARNSALNLRRFDMKQILLTSVSNHCTGATTAAQDVKTATLPTMLTQAGCQSGLLRRS